MKPEYLAIIAVFATFGLLLVGRLISVAVDGSGAAAVRFIVPES